MIRIPPLPANWPVALLFACLLLLPFSRLTGVAVAIICIVVLVNWARCPGEYFKACGLFLTLFAGWWLPMLISVPLSVDVGRSAEVTVAAVRFLLLGIFALIFLTQLTQHRRLQAWTAWLICLWALDVLVQVMAGVSLLGMPLPVDRPNGVFGQAHMKLGPILATLSPLLLIYARRYGPSWAFPVGWFLLVVALLVIGTRAAWVSFAVVTIGLVLREVFRSGRLSWKGPAALIMAVILAAGAAWQLSPQFKQRLESASRVLTNQGDVDHALAQRLDIWQGAVAMIEDRPLTGVGVRGFRVAWPDYEQLDPSHWQTGSSHDALHAHHLFLELVSETGLVGLLGFLLAVAVAIRMWRNASVQQREGAWPYALALIAALFPLNTHYALYSTFWSVVVMWLLALYVSALNAQSEGVPADR